MSITSRKLAELAGVSRGTVDRVINRRGGVAPEVQKLIERLAAEYNYIPNRAGRALVMREPMTVAVLLNSMGNPFFDEVKRGLTAAIADYSDFPVVLRLYESKGYKPETQIEQINAAIYKTIAETGKKPAGIIITPINHPGVAGRLNELIDGGCPAIALNSDLDGCRRLVYVGCDYTRSGQTAAQMMGLMTRGKSVLKQRKIRILAVTGSLKVKGHFQRIDGFSGVIREQYPDSELVRVLENNDDDALSAEAVAAALRNDTEIDAIYFGAGGVAGGVHAITENAARPLTVVSCDLTDDTRRFLLDGTIQATIGQQPYRQGFTAAKLLLDRLLFGREPESGEFYTDNEIITKYNM